MSTSREDSTPCPPELDDLYAKILDDIDPCYSATASQYFQLLLANEGSAEGLLLLSFADEDKGFCLTLPSAIMSPDEHSARLETLGRRLSGSCKGLLEIGSGGRVTFLHQTLRDFLVRPENQEKVGNATRESDFDAHLQLCSAFYCPMKAVAFSTWANSSPGDPTVTDHLKDAFQTPDSMSRGSQYVVMKWFTERLKSASHVTVGNHDMINVLDSLNNDLKALPRLRRQLSAEVALSTDSPVDEHGWFFMDWSVSGRGILFIYDDLLPLATRYGVTDYVQAKAQSSARYYSPHNPYASNWARLLKFVFGRPIPAFRDGRGYFQTSLYPNASLVDPPSPEMFKALSPWLPWSCGEISFGSFESYHVAGNPRDSSIRQSSPVWSLYAGSDHRCRFDIISCPEDGVCGKPGVEPVGSCSSTIHHVLWSKA